MAQGIAGTPRWFVFGLLGLFVLGLGIRVAYTERTNEPDRPGYLVNYDPIFYHLQANAVAEGRGFVAVYRAGDHPSAKHPPLLVVALAAASAAGFDGFHAHRLLTALIGALAVPVIGLLGVRLAGWRAGLIAAGLAAVYPGLWANDGLIMPESPYVVLTALVLLLAYTAWKSFTPWVAAALGAAIGLAALTRGEAVLAIPLLVLPLAIRAPGLTRRRRVGALAIVTGAAIVVVLPWTVYNLRRFEKPVFVSTAMEETLGGANCDLSYSGGGIGYWTTECFAQVNENALEESVAASRVRTLAREYVSNHKGRVPVVLLARVARVWDIYHPSRAISASELQNRPRRVAWAGLISYYVLMAIAIVGAVVLKRRKVTLLPIVSVVAMVFVTAIISYGNARFRIPAEVAIVALAAVAFDAIPWRQQTPSPKAVLA